MSLVTAGLLDTERQSTATMVCRIGCICYCYSSPHVPLISRLLLLLLLFLCGSSMALPLSLAARSSLDCFFLFFPMSLSSLWGGSLPSPSLSYPDITENRRTGNCCGRCALPTSNATTQSNWLSLQMIGEQNKIATKNRAAKQTAIQLLC